MHELLSTQRTGFVDVIGNQAIGGGLGVRAAHIQPLGSTAAAELEAAETTGSHSSRVCSRRKGEQEQGGRARAVDAVWDRNRQQSMYVYDSCWKRQ